MDAGDGLGRAVFPLRAAKKSSLYRNEVTEAACQAVLQAVERFAGGYVPTPLAGHGRTWPPAAADEAGRPRDRLAARRCRDGVAQDQRRRRLSRRRRLPVRRPLPHLRCMAGSHPARCVGGEGGELLGAPRNRRAAQDRRRCDLDRPRAKREGDFKLPAALAFPDELPRFPTHCRGLVAGRRGHLAGHRLRGGGGSAFSPSSSTTARCRPGSAGACARRWRGPGSGRRRSSS
jgi:hypothetical protein